MHLVAPTLRDILAKSRALREFDPTDKAHMPATKSGLDELEVTVRVISREREESFQDEFNPRATN